MPLLLSVLFRFDGDVPHSSRAYAAHGRGHPREGLHLFLLVSLRLCIFSVFCAIIIPKVLLFFLCHGMMLSLISYIIRSNNNT